MLEIFEVGIFEFEAAKIWGVSLGVNYNSYTCILFKFKK